MTFQLLIIVLQLAALAAFLILWYFWVKRKLEASFLLEEEENVLFPFRYFSWIFIGVILITCLVQIHFVRVSSSVYERMASLSSSFKKQEQHTKAIDDLKLTVDKLRADLESNFRTLRAQSISSLDRIAENTAETKPLAAPKDTRTASSLKDRSALLTGQGLKPEGQGFGREARAFFRP